MRGAFRWVGISVAGLVLVVAGIIMLFTPGPGIAAILAGLAIWARQFLWARRRLEAIIDRMHAKREKLPAFAVRFLDERMRRRAIREHAEAVAKGEDPGPLDLDLSDESEPTLPAEALAEGADGTAQERPTADHPTADRPTADRSTDGHSTDGHSTDGHSNAGAADEPAGDSERGVDVDSLDAREIDVA